MKPEIFEKLIQIRRQIHSKPELGYEEFDSTDLIADELLAIEIPFKKNIIKTGLIAELKKGEGPCIILIKGRFRCLAYPGRNGSEI